MPKDSDYTQSGTNRFGHAEAIKASEGEKEEITDLFNLKPEIYTDIDLDTDKFRFHKGKVLRFKYEGSLTTIRITKIDRKNKRMWGQHIELVNPAIAKSHYGHNVDTTQVPMWCTDCDVPITEHSTEDGDVKAADRKDKTLSDGTIIDE